MMYRQLRTSKAVSVSKDGWAVMHVHMYLVTAYLDVVRDLSQQNYTKKTAVGKRANLQMMFSNT